MKLYLVRHGECEANVQGVVAGARDDSPLTAKGLEQAQAVAAKLAGYDFDIIIVSPLKRAMDTAKAIAGACGYIKEIDVDRRIIERDVGPATGLPSSEYFALEKAGPIDGAETEEQMYARLTDFVQELKARSEESVLLVGHNGTFRMLRCVLEGRLASDFPFIEPLHNGEVYEVEV